MRHPVTYLLLAAALFFGSPAANGQEASDEMAQSLSGSRRQARLFDEHIVRMGETAFSIARGYAVSPLTLAADNPAVDLGNLRVGQVLLIRKKERGRTDPAEVARQWNEMTGRTEQTSSQIDGEEVARDATPTEPLADTLWGAPEEERGANWTDGTGWPIRSPRDFSSGGTPHIALMLPLSGTNANPYGNDFTDFYRGALLALENLKARGHSAVVTLYDSGRSVHKMQSIVSSAEFMETDLVIGPVYDNEMEPAVRFGQTFGVPVVSPLATTTHLDSEVLYKMAPDPSTKYDKLRPLLEGDINIILVSSGQGGVRDDTEFEHEMTTLLAGRNYGRFTIGDQEGEIASLIDWDRPNVLVVLAAGERGVDSALASISTSYNNASAARRRRASISVVGSSRWSNYGAQIDRNLFFKLGVRFVTSYYIDRSNTATRLFEARYLEAYGDFPNRAAFRGYDAVTLFAGALFESGWSFAERLERVGATPLATPYRFTRSGVGPSPSDGGMLLGDDRIFGVDGSLFGDGAQFDRGGLHVNDQWTLVSFGSDYTVSTQ